MPIPARLRTPPISAKELQAFCKLCDEIEDGVNAGRDVSALLKQWNRRAGRRHELWEFTSYNAACSKADFVKGALLPKPEFVDDLRYDELRSVLQAVATAEMDAAELTFYLHWLEANLPGSGISDLIYWPDHWFKDPGNAELLHAELTPDQILAYAMMRSGRVVSGAPSNVARPFAMPQDK